MSSINIVCLVVLTSTTTINFLPCVNCQLPNIYDLTWFDSFSLENYEGLFNNHDRTHGSNPETSNILPHGSAIDENLMSSSNDFEKFAKTTEDNNESADASLEEGGHFDSRFVQQSDRYKIAINVSSPL